jgi:hypothetical protein
MLEDLGYWQKMHNGQLISSVRRETPAKIMAEGKSQIITFWDEHRSYLCTIHRVITKNGQVIHEDIKDATVNGVRYQTIK